MPEYLVNSEIAQKLGLSPEEFEKIRSNLGRLPNFIELCLLSASWLDKKSCASVHKLLKSASKNKKLIADASGNNKTIIKLNDFAACFIKVESNNIPSVLGPYNEALNCLANAGREVIASGAIPVAGLNTFRFGLPENENTKHIASEYLKGIGEIGNSSGYPIVGAKISFEKCFNDKPELNTMVIGLLDNQKKQSKEGNLNDCSLFIVGNKHIPETLSKDVISSKEDIENLKYKIGTHSGLEEKILYESIIEALESGVIHEIRSIGSSGILTNLSDLALSINKGFRLEIGNVGIEKNNDAIISFLLDRQFARFILIVEKGKEKQLGKIFDKWEIHFKEIGKVSKDKKFLISFNSERIAEIPTDLLHHELDLPDFKSQTETSKLKTVSHSDLEKIPMPEKLKDVAWFLIKHPNIASKKWINEQYDSMAGVGNMSTNFISDSCLINMKGTENALALCMTGNQKHIKADPSIGTQISIASAIRKIVCSGAKPLAVVPSISFVNLEQSDDCLMMGQLFDGLNKACDKFKLPITNENIKFINQTDNNKPVSGCPSFTLGMLGFLENKKHQMTISFQDKGNIIFLIGPSKEDIAASEYLVSYHKKDLENPPFFDLDLEFKVQSAIQELIKKDYICSAHNVSRGGLFISLVESAMAYGFGFDIITDTDIRLDAFLFGESQGRVLVSINPSKESNFIDLMMKKDVPFLALGHVTKGEMRIDDISFGFIEDARKTYENALEEVICK